MPNPIIDTKQLKTLMIQNQMIPKEGPLAVSLLLDFSFATGLTQYTLDFSQYQWLAKLSIIQSVYIDNSTNGVPLVLQDVNTGYTIVANPHTQGWYQILSPVPTKVQFNCSGGPNNVNVIFANVPIAGVVWAATHP